MTAPPTVLVTGASGFVGRHVVAALEAAGVEVVPVPHRWTHIDEVEARLGERSVDWCAHLGWYADPADYLVNRSENLRSLNDTIDLAVLLGRRGGAHLVVAGSSAEYAGSPDVLGEAAPIAPWSAYGAAKAAAHLLLTSSARPPELTLGWARLFNMTGPGEHPARLLPSATRAFLRGDPIALSSGHQVRDFLDVADVAAAIVALGTTRAVGTFNICSGTGVSLRTLIGDLAARLDASELARFGDRPVGANDPASVVGDPTRLRRTTGWLPRYDTAAMITRVVTYWTEIEQDAETP